MTVPCLELTASTVAVRLNSMIQQHLGVYYFWTDSMSVLKYMWNETSRFPTFVSNRLAVIKEATEKSQWRYVPSDQNSGDDVSRGMSANNIVHSTRWLSGPAFLSCPESEWPQLSTNMSFTDVLEVNTDSSCSAVALDVPVITRLVEYFSD